MATDTKTASINTPNNGSRVRSVGSNDQPKSNSVELPTSFDYGKVQGGSLAILYQCMNAMIENMKYVMEISAELAQEQSKIQSKVTEANVKAEIDAGEHKASATKSAAIGEIVGGAIGLGFTGGGLMRNAATNSKLNTAETNQNSLNTIEAKTQARLGELQGGDTVVADGTAPARPPAAPFEASPTRTEAQAREALAKAEGGDFSKLMLKTDAKGKEVHRTEAEIQNDLRLATREQLVAIQQKLAPEHQKAQNKVKTLGESMDRWSNGARSGTQIGGELSKGSFNILSSEEMVEEAEDNARKTAAAATQQIAETGKEKNINQVNEAYNQILQQLAALKAAGQEAARGA